jgi:hypothetical protein
MTTIQNRATFLARAVGWLRAGYPSGVPRQDYVVLFGLLRRSLTEQEVHAIADDLAAQTATGDGTAVITREEIARMIDESVLQEASDEDIARVSARLAAGGWPLASAPS